MFLSGNKLKISSVGMVDEQSSFFKKFLKDYGSLLSSKWLYTGNYEPNEMINTMGSDIETEYVLIDIDDEIGKRVWYFLSALRDENKTIAFTREPWATDAKFVIKKPLFDFHVKKGLLDFKKNTQPEEAQRLVELLNKIGGEN